MRKNTGMILILGSFILTIICWLFVQTLQAAPTSREYSQLIATLALVGFAWVNFISTRYSILDKWFNGLDKSYIYHKYLSIISLVMILIHKISINTGRRRFGFSTDLGNSFPQGVKTRRN